MHKLCLIIPTKDRPFELEHLLNSIEVQSILPGQIIIVDGGNPGIKYLSDKFSELSVDYLQVLPPGLTRQRNAGLKIVKENIDLVGFLDDDVVLEKDCLSNMLNFWERAPDQLGGAGFNIVNITPSPKTWWAELLMSKSLRDKKSGSLLRNGRNVPYCPAKVTLETDWLCGGATVWKKEIFDKFEFDEWFASYGVVEDLDFSYRVRKYYKLAVVANARVQHIETGEKDYFFWAYIVTMNHIYFAYKHPDFSSLLCALSFFNEGIKCLMYGVLLRNKNYVYRGAGHIWAVIRRFFLGIHRVERQVKSSTPQTI